MNDAGENLKGRKWDDSRSEDMRVVRVTCPHDCPDSCSMLVTVDNRTGRAIRNEGDPSHPITRGFLCGKVNNYTDLVYNGNRVLYPHRRIGPKGPSARFERISWDCALNTICSSFQSVIHEYGPEAIQPFSYSGTLGILNFEGMSERFWNRMGAARLQRTICTAAGRTAGLVTTGQVDEADIENLPRMDLIILWATNVVSTSVHMVPLLNEARSNGAKIIAIDPRVTRTTVYADKHLQPRPGTDSALALGMMKIIVDSNLHDVNFLREHSVGWRELIEQRLPRFTIDRVSRTTGLSGSDIEALALAYGSTKRSFIRLNWGLQRHDNGGMMTRCVRVLPILTGALSTGGGICVGTAEEMRGVNRTKLHRPDLLQGRQPRSINMIQIGRALNDNMLAPPIKALYCWNSDLINCVPDTNSVRQGLSRNDLFVAVHDTFWTDTTNYADIVLPADTCFERMDLHGAYGNYYFSLSMPAIEKLGESLDNQEVFRRLAARMGYGDPCFQETDEQMIRDILDPNDNPLFEGITFEYLRNRGWAKASVDSPRRPGLRTGRWKTPSGKIEIYSRALVEKGLDPLPDHVSEKEGCESVSESARYPLQVISAASHHFIGNSFRPVERLQESASRPCFEVSPKDARERGIEDGDPCVLYNSRGCAYGYAVIVDELLPGVIGAQKQMGHINCLCSQDEADMGGAPVFYSVLAEIRKLNPSEVDEMERSLNCQRMPV